MQFNMLLNNVNISFRINKTLILNLKTIGEIAKIAKIKKYTV
jgi:hypothetical protein